MINKIVVGQHDHRPAVQAGTEDPFARDLKIVAIDQRIHGRTFIPGLPGLQVMNRLMQEETTPQTSMV
ncbi:hypothetical protein [Hydrogenophaga sp.]|uniref:hypothetical protein n=1 Tax=Hydrogenophaga sp. TaxID=1904254 RepID=UPI0035AF8BBA